MSGVPEVKVPLSIAILPDAPAEALPVKRDIDPVPPATAKVLIVRAEAVVSPDWMVKVPAVVFQVEAPLVAVKLREVAPVMAKAPPEVDQVEAAAPVIVKAPDVVVVRLKGPEATVIVSPPVPGPVIILAVVPLKVKLPPKVTSPVPVWVIVVLSVPFPRPIEAVLELPILTEPLVDVPLPPIMVTDPPVEVVPDSSPAFKVRAAPVPEMVELLPGWTIIAVGAVPASVVISAA